MSATDPDPVRVSVSGAGGRMGRTILGLASAHPRLQVTSALEAEGHPVIGQDVGELCGLTASGVRVTSNPAEAFAVADVVIEFTLPEPTLEHLNVAARSDCAAVVGTTGFDAAQQNELSSLSEQMPLLLASNMSIGVTLLTQVVREVAQKLGSAFDIEIVETHHRRKKDAPSGTALTLARAAAEGRDADLERWAKYGRSGIIGERPDEEIGVMALRGGDVVGDHTVYFYGTGERLELTHRAQSRDAFASGAVRAAAWIAGRPAGSYSIQDVLFETESEMPTPTRPS